MAAQDKIKTERTIHYRHQYLRELERSCQYVGALMYGTGQMPDGRGRHRGETEPVSTLTLGQIKRIIRLGDPRPYLKQARRFLDDAGEPETLNQRTEFTRE